mmetsp:Transcript_6552/g.13729  ORF Transcript_6552/g.13729 Transcript_6552/m.13729 type:complete len:109 (+) Transcript_6552:1187-1513(+)
MQRRRQYQLTPFRTGCRQEKKSAYGTDADSGESTDILLCESVRVHLICILSSFSLFQSTIRCHPDAPPPRTRPFFNNLEQTPPPRSAQGNQHGRPRSSAIVIDHPPHA